MYANAQMGPKEVKAYCRVGSREPRQCEKRKDSRCPEAEIFTLP
jgi:hypothetical protein